MSSELESRLRLNGKGKSDLEEKCVFCEIAQGEGEAYVVYQDENYIAFLSNRHIKVGRGIAPVIIAMPKEHYNSNPAKVPKKVWNGLQRFVYELIQYYSEMRNIERVCEYVEGFAVDHFHIKLVLVPKGRGYRKVINKQRKYTADYLKKGMKGRQRRLYKRFKIERI